MQMVDECYQCLTCIANRAEGQDAMIKHKTVRTLCSVIAREMYGKKSIPFYDDILY